MLASQSERLLLQPPRRARSHETLSHRIELKSTNRSHGAFVEDMVVPDVTDAWLQRHSMALTEASWSTAKLPAATA